MKELHTIKQWHIVISGFTQGAGDLHGCERLEMQMRAIASPTVYVGLRTWQNDWAGLARKIDRVSHKNPQVFVYAYSWGAGNGFVRLAKELGKRGIAVQHAVLADPVYCSPIASGIPGLRWLSRGAGVLARKTIKAPDNVRRIDYFTQSETFPRGSDIAGDPERVHHAGKLAYTHNTIDDSDEFHRLSLAVSKKGGRSA
jgi:hypothetical protein